MKNTLPAPVGGLLRLPAVLQLIPVSRSAWWAGIKAGRFPAGTKLSARVTVWSAAQIQHLITTLIK